MSWRLMLAFVALLAFQPFVVAENTTDVVVYGATPAGIAAACAAADDGERVTLIEPTNRIGGLVSNGLSHTDFRTFEGLSGAYLDFANRVEAHYKKHYGLESKQYRDCFRGTFGEPKVNLAIFKQMIAERPLIRLELGWTLIDVKLEQKHLGEQTLTQIAELKVKHKTNQEAIFTAKQFIDASYEGDLMARAGVPWRVGRESRAEFNEALAPEQADDQLQAYNFRWVMTRKPDNRVTPEKPAGYRRELFLPVLDLLNTNQFTSIFGYPSKCIFKAQLPPLPNSKFDINDVSNGLIRLSLAGQNQAWPDGSDAQRAEIMDRHRLDQEGLLYFLQNDEAVPEHYRREAREWGWCKDEFVENNHLPEQLYVREARRMVGSTMFTQKDGSAAPNDARSVWQPDAIAVGDYGFNCHGTSHEGPRFGGKHTGEFYYHVAPYQIPYGVIVPRKVTNLLVPTAMSASHVGFCALRLEPIWMSLGQAAGHACHLANRDHVPVQNISVATLQKRLHEKRSATIYISDVPPSDPRFRAVQWWGTLGGFHGLVNMPIRFGQRGKNITGQYFEAYPHHEAKLAAELDQSTKTMWLELIKKHDLNIKEIERPGITREQFIVMAYQQVHN